LGYSALIDAIKSRIPGCHIVVQSIPPTTSATAASRPKFSKDNIIEYNARLLDVAIQKGVYFLDVHSALLGDDGYLMGDIAAPDGIHLKPSGYQIWYDYILSHAIKGEAFYSIDGSGHIKYISPGGAPEVPEGAEEGDEPPEEEPPENEDSAENADLPAGGSEPPPAG
jgi:hypothetical protein